MSCIARMILSCLIVFEAAAFTTVVSANEEEEVEERQCTPKCRDGFYCHAGECVSPCNPPCAGGEVCSRKGMCIPSDPQPAPAAATTGKGWSGVGSRSPEKARPTRPDYSREIAEAERKKGVGAFFMTMGILGFIGAFTFGFISGYAGEEEFLYIGVAIEAASIAMFVPGIVAVVKNRKRIRKWQQWSSLDDPASRVGMGFFLREGGGGLSLSVAL